MSVVDYILNRDENGMVRYLYVNVGKHPCICKTKWESAKWMLENDMKREIRMSGEYEGFPLTADGVYFFDGEICEVESEGEATSSVTANAVPPSPETQAAPAGEGFWGDGDGENVAPVCGPDWCEIPEVAEKPKKKRTRRVKDVVCE